MKRRIIAILLVAALLAALLTACKGNDKPSDPTHTIEPASFTGNAVTAYHLDALGNADNSVLMMVLLSDGWILDVALGMLYDIEPGFIQGMAYEAVSDDVFIWKPSAEDLSQTEAENANLKMRIIYSDPDGRFVVYSPNIENPDLANVIINPDYFNEIADKDSRITDKNFQIFYKITDKGLLKVSDSLENLPGIDDYKDQD